MNKVDLVPDEEESADTCSTKANTLVVFSTGEGSEAISLCDWHRRIGHRGMKTIIDMVNGTVTSKLGAHALEPPELTHGAHAGRINQSLPIRFHTSGR